MTESTIIYTYTDEAPLLATYSFLPIVEAYAAKAMAELTDEEIFKIVRGNAIELFGLDEDLDAGGI